MKCGFHSSQLGVKNLLPYPLGEWNPTRNSPPKILIELSLQHNQYVIPNPYTDKFTFPDQKIIIPSDHNFSKTECRYHGKRRRI
jgi:hypothetical protein